MKLAKIISVLMALCFIIPLASCGKKQPLPACTHENSASRVYVYVDQSRVSDGVYSCTTSYPTVIIPSASDKADKINAYGEMKNYLESSDKTNQQLAEMFKKDPKINDPYSYDVLSEAYLSGSALSLTYTSETHVSEDSKVTSYFYYVFDTKTGEAITLKNMLKNEDESTKTALSEVIAKAFIEQNDKTALSKTGKHEEKAKELADAFVSDAEVSSVKVSKYCKLNANGIVITIPKGLFSSSEIKAEIKYDVLGDKLAPKYLPVNDEAEDTMEFAKVNRDNFEKQTFSEEIGTSSTMGIVTFGHAEHFVIRNAGDNNIVFYGSHVENALIWLDDTAGNEFIIEYNGNSETIKF